VSFLTQARVDEARARAPESLRRAAHTLTLREQLDTDILEAIRREVGEFGAQERFDVFLSHAAATADKALGVWQLLSEAPYGFRVYMDWIHDPRPDRQTVGQAMAAVLRARMQASQCLIYVVTDRSQHSVWMPWELGYFDAYKSNVGVLPVVSNDAAGFQGREYLSLYDLVTLDRAADMARTTSPPATPEADALAQMKWLAEAAAVNVDEFVRRMQARPELAGEWLRPHARATMERGPAMATFDPTKASQETTSLGSIYAEEWARLLKSLSEPGRRGR
jgi:hypothetical protein